MLAGHLRQNVTAAPPGPPKGCTFIVSDPAAARDELIGRGTNVSEVFHNEASMQARRSTAGILLLRVSG